MLTSCTFRKHVRFAAALATVAGLWLAASPAGAQHVVRVEEDWVLTLTEPDSYTSSPQVTVQMNPDSTNEYNFAVFCVNFQEIPDFEEGGLEIQLWEGDVNTRVRGSDEMKLACDGEVITWTQYLKVDNGKLYFGIQEGVSLSYGAFGGDLFKVRSSGSYSSLDSYTTQDSVDNSGATYGANRIEHLQIVQVRKYFSDGTVQVDGSLWSVVDAAVE
jgi:hypothetical protein